jgi:large subunit ribosomal protein L25
VNQEQLAVEPRTVTGKKVRFLRRQGITPANVYGAGQESLAIQAPTVELKRVLRAVGHTQLVSLTVAGEGRPRPALVREVQHDALGGELLHVDFNQVNMQVVMAAEVPISFTGESPAVKRGSLLLHSLSTLQVEALPDHIPPGVAVDVSGLDEDDAAIHVRDLTLPPGVTVLTDGDTLVVKVQASRAEVAEEAAEPAGAAAEGEAPESEG